MSRAGAAPIVEIARDLPVVRVQVSLPAGSAADPPGREGLARMTAEMLRRGAGGRSKAAIDEALDRLGSDLACAADAEAITLVGHVLSRNLGPFLEIVRDALAAPDFSPEEIEKLRREMVAELDEVRDDDRALCRRFFSRHLYGDHPYGRPPGGTRASLAAIRREHLVELHRAACARAGAILGASGDLDERALAGVAALAGALPERDAPPPPEAAPAAPPRGRDLLIVDKPERTQTQILIGHPAVRWADPDFFPLSVATTAFGGTFTSRLMTEVRVRRGLSYGAYASLSAGRAAGHASLWVFPAARDTADTLALVLGLLEEFVRDGPSDDEVAFARDHLAGHFPLAVQTPERRLALRAELALCGMDDAYLRDYRARVAAVTPAEARAAVARHLRADRLAITLVATAADTRPALDARAADLGLARVAAVAHDSW